MEDIMENQELCFLTATELTRRIRAGKLSATEVMEAHLAQIERVNPKVNAIVTFLPEQALEQARAADDALARGEAAGPLHGLPVAHKDLTPTKGIRTTLGSLAFKDFIPQEDGLIKVWRAWYFALVLSELLETQRDKLKGSVIWNIEEGMKLSGPQTGEAERKRTELYHRIRKFMETYEFLILPVSQVPPFDVKQRYVKEINGEKMETYIDWMKSCYYITTTGFPAISVPCGFTKEGLPVGVQIVGRHRDDLGVLQLAYAFEQASGFWKQKPPVVL